MRIRTMVIEPLRVALFAASLATSFVATNAQAQTVRHFYTGVRQLGMGGAYTGVVNDETAILLNPAALGRIRENTAVLIDPEVSGSLNDSKALKLSQVSKILDPEQVKEDLNTPANRDIHYFAKAQIFPSFVTTNFGLGLNIKYQMDAQVDAAGSKYNLYYLKDYAAATAYNVRLAGGVIKFGFGIHVVDRSEIDKIIDTTVGGIDVASQGAEGIGLATDFGLILTAPIDYLPSVSLVSHDLGTTSFTLAKGMFNNTAARPEAVGRNTDVGFTMSPLLGHETRSTFTAEVQNIEGFKTDSDFFRHFHTGGEINVSDFMFLRAGLNERYWTAGVEFATQEVQIQAATYGEDVGIQPAHKEDRRWVVKVAIRL